MLTYDWDFSVFLPYLGALVRGAIVSIELTLISSIAGTVLGILIAFPLRSRRFGTALSWVNDAMRAIPLIVLLFLFYYFPSRELLGLTSVSAFWAAAAALTLAQGNFTAEVVRTAMDGVPDSLVVSARSLGLKESAIFVHVIAPNVARQTLPTLIAFYIGNLKLSSLASIIGTEDVVYVARIAVSQTFRSLEAWILVACIYIILVTPCTILARKIEQSERMGRR
jgi:polar amino acid transport system permease protein